jgi:hypothetical protein
MALHVDIEDRHAASPSEIEKVAQKVCPVPEALTRYGTDNLLSGKLHQ